MGAILSCIFGVGGLGPDTVSAVQNHVYVNNSTLKPEIMLIAHVQTKIKYY